MSELQIVLALRAKRDELDRIISSYEAVLATARRDFLSVNATLEIFEKGSELAAYPSHLSIARMFKRGELFELCKTALAEAHEGLDTRELACAVIRAKGMDPADGVLRKAIGFKIVRTMLRQQMRGQVQSTGKRKGTMMWKSVLLKSS